MTKGMTREEIGDKTLVETMLMVVVNNEVEDEDQKTV